MPENIACKTVLKLPQVDSTNAYLEAGINEGRAYKSRSVIISDFQIEGRGNGNNTWESEAGKNLLISIFYEPIKLKAAQQFYLNMAVSLGVMECITDILDEEEVSIKWPNDIYVDKMKIGGMLIKHSVSGKYLINSILGIGLNVNQQVFNSNAPNPVSLIHYLKTNQNRDEVLDLLLKSIDKRLNQLEAGYLNLLKSDYLKNLFAFKNYRRYLYENKLINAKITGVSEFGSLQLEVANGEALECDLKEIKFVF